MKQRDVLRVNRKLQSRYSRHVFLVFVRSFLPKSFKGYLHRIFDRSGLTFLITEVSELKFDSPHNAALRTIVKKGINGSSEDFSKEVAKLQIGYVPSEYDAKVIQLGKNFLFYSTKSSEEEVLLAWWSNPAPGNFGDWLSPLIFSTYTESKVLYQSPIRIAAKRHIVGLGSIARYIKSNSIVVGTGVIEDNFEVSDKAQYVSVRGPITARMVKKSGGPDVECFGDPGVLISRIIPISRTATNGRLALVRHYVHATIPVTKPENMDEFDVMVGDSDGIRILVKELNKYDVVVTSAMHIYIACQSYGIPCALVTFDVFGVALPGDGSKFVDYALGIGLPVVIPTNVGTDLRAINFDDIVTDFVVKDGKIDEIESAVHRSLQVLASRD